MASTYSDICSHSKSFPTSTESFVEAHWKSYTRVVNDCCLALSSVWTEVGLSLSEVESQLTSIAGKSTIVWSEAVTDAEQHKNELMEKIHRLELEVSELRAQLGDSPTFDTWKTNLNLKQRFEQINKLKAQCQELKQIRIAEFKDVLAKIDAIRAQFGQQLDESLNFEDAKCNLSRESLEFLKRDLESFCAEQSRRLQTLESLWRSFKLMCTELGEDSHEMIKSLRSNLECLDQRFTGSSMGRKIQLEHCLDLESAVSWHNIKAPYLSQETFLLIEDKLSWLRTERNKRDQNLTYKQETLEGLWDALHIPKADLERSILTRLVEGPARLHQKTLQRVEGEINRQQTAQSRVLKTLVERKLDEMERVCEAGRLGIPEEARIIFERERLAKSKNCVSSGHYAEALNTLNRLITDARAMLQKRTEIITMIEEFEDARKEVDWLIDYEVDEDRYKGRDCNRKLQRSIKAGKLRDRMPTLIEKITGAILEWEKAERKPFILDGINYRTDVLEKYEMIIPAAPLPQGRKTPVPKPRRVSTTSLDHVSPSKSAVFISETKKKKETKAQTKLVDSNVKIGRRSQSRTGLPSQDVMKKSNRHHDPLMEHLDQLRGDQRSDTPSNVMKSAIPGVPKSNQRNGGGIARVKTPWNQTNKKIKDPMESADVIMEDAFTKPKERRPITKASLPPPKQNSKSVHKGYSNRTSPDKAMSPRRFTF